MTVCVVSSSRTPTAMSCSSVVLGDEHQSKWAKVFCGRSRPTMLVPKGGSGVIRELSGEDLSHRAGPVRPGRDPLCGVRLLLSERVSLQAGAAAVINLHAGGRRSGNVDRPRSR